MSSATTETTLPAAAAPWEAGTTSSLDRAGGSAEDLMARMNNSAESSAGSTGHASARPGPNATFDDTTTPSSNQTSSKEVNRESSRNQRPSDAEPSTDKTAVNVATANIKYKNQAGRAAILAVSTAVHHDFGALTSILNVTLPAEAIAELTRNPDVEWVDGNGAVYFVQPWKY